MKPIVIVLIGFIALAGWTTFSRWHFMCKMLDRCAEIPMASDAERTKDLSLTADGKILLKDYEQFGFEANAAAPVFTENNKVFINAVEQYLTDNPKAQLRITGQLLASEKGIAAGIFENLGIARAAAIRDELVNRGLKNPIVLDYKINDDLMKPLSFEAVLNDIPDDYDAANQQFVFKNMNFSEIKFAYNSDVFNPNQAFNSYADSVKIYFTENPKKTLTVIGHTDVTGADTYNIGLGKRRAVSVRNYLMKTQGIDGKRIKTASKGEGEPAFKPADSEVNKAKNRRVNIKIE